MIEVLKLIFFQFIKIVWFFLTIFYKTLPNKSARGTHDFFHTVLQIKSNLHQKYFLIDQINFYFNLKLSMSSHTQIFEIFQSGDNGDLSIWKIDFVETVEPKN